MTGRPAYHTYTTDDPFALKRWLHRRRFLAAFRALHTSPTGSVLDYGCGDGYFLALLRHRLPNSSLTGFDPLPNMAAQARERLAGLGILITEDLKTLGQQRFDRIACLETCEHLVESDLRRLLEAIRDRLTPDGQALFSVPVEIGPPALVKNLFRLLRRKGYENLNWKTVIRATLGRPQPQHVSQALPGREYIFSHIGFDHRRFERLLRDNFHVSRRTTVPIPLFGPFFNNTLLYACRAR